ncbi:MAG: sigma-70 family RNA polymerase sigma factor [Gemmataceae bacterium]
MARAAANRLVEVLRAAGADHSRPSDAELLDRFRHGRDEEAFTQLVRRHARAVSAACRQVLADPADVDDVFQATFVVLFRKVRSVDGATAGSWLYAVAHRLAVRCRSRRPPSGRARSRPARRPPAGAASHPDRPWSEAVAVLHEELDRLPDAVGSSSCATCGAGPARRRPPTSAGRRGRSRGGWSGGGGCSPAGWPGGASVRLPCSWRR